MQQPCFITAVTFRRAAILAEQSAVAIVLANLEFYRKKHGYRLCGFVVMPDHWHFLVISAANSLGTVLRDLKSMIGRQLIDAWKAAPTAQGVLQRIELATPGPKNHRHSVWQPGNWTVVVETSQGIEGRLDSMHRNPVRAGLAERAIDWPWSSARWYLLGQDVGIKLDTDWAL